MSQFLLSIERVDGDIVMLRPGSQGERDLVESIVDNVLSRSVGVFRTKVQVAEAVRAACNDVLMLAKSEVLP